MKFRKKSILFLVALVISLSYISCSKKPHDNPSLQTNLSITDISQKSGSFNDIVTITGTGFSTNLSDDIITFNGRPASVIDATTTSFKVSVPKGAGTGKIGLSVGGNTVTGPIFTYVYTVTVSTLAGSGRDTVADGTGINASFHGMEAIASDSKGNIYAPDPQANVIRKVTPDGVVTTFAGSGQLGYAMEKGVRLHLVLPKALWWIAMTMCSSQMAIINR